MPKKRRAALFDVMAVNRTLEPVVKRRSLFHSPSLWSIFKRQGGTPAPLVDDAPIEEYARMAEADPTYRIEREVPAREAVVRETPAQVDRTPRVPWRDRLPFKLDATNSVIAASGVVIVIGLVALVAHKFGGEPMPTLAAVSTTDSHKPAPRPGVLDVPRRTAPAAPLLPPEPAKSSVDDSAAPEKTEPATPGKRIINMNYLMIQSYSEEKIARDAADVLVKNGVDCTVIQGLTRWSPSPRWFCIVGTKGFGPRTADTAEFQAYRQKILEIGNTFAGRSKWKQFNPQMYRWGADSEKP